MPRKLIARCICGAEVKIPVSHSMTCPNCGLELRQERNGKTVTPIARIPENSLEERRAAGKPVKYDRPESLHWDW